MQLLPLCDFRTLYQFNHPQRTISPSPQPRQPLIFLSLWTGLFWVFPVNGIIQYMVLCIWLPSLCTNIFKAHPCCRVYQYSILFLWLNNLLDGHIIFYLYIHQLIEFGLFPLFGYYEECWCEYLQTSFLEDTFSFPWATHCEVELLDHVATLCLTNTLRNCPTVFQKWLHHFFISTSN